MYSCMYSAMCTIHDRRLSSCTQNEVTLTLIIKLHKLSRYTNTQKYAFIYVLRIWKNLDISLSKVLEQQPCMHAHRLALRFYIPLE